MANIMTYSELSDICDAKRILLKNVAESSGLTYDGLRNGMIKQSLGMTKVLRICEAVGITPNQFFGWNEEKATYNTSQVGMVNNQNIGAMGVEILQQQLAVKDEQIKQLHQLLQLLNK